MTMRLKFLGTGDCAGTPVYNCSCSVCLKASHDPKLKRASSCAQIITPKQNILIDAGSPERCLAIPGKTLTRILVSHYHIDHVLGLFSLRWGKTITIPVNGPDDPDGCADLYKHNGILDFSDKLEPFSKRVFSDIEITPLPLNHSKPTLGFAIHHEKSRLAWLCDTGGLPAESLNFLSKWHPTTMVLDCTYPPSSPRPSDHNDINMAIKVHKTVQPEKTYLTHVGHDLMMWITQNDAQLPDTIHIAHDNLMITP